MSHQKNQVTLLPIRQHRLMNEIFLMNTTDNSEKSHKNKIQFQSEEATLKNPENCLRRGSTDALCFD